jgi:benzoyl-CoA 2,3-dioxygenase component A
MNAMTEAAVIQQHLIDPEICIRCNTCEATCPVGAITHDSRNYVVDADKCNLCMACVPPCPTGSIDNWRQMPRVRAYSVEEQLGWDSLPAELPAQELAGYSEPSPSASSGDDAAPAEASLSSSALAAQPAAFNSAQYGATVPPWSAAHAYTNLYGPKAAVKSLTATVTGNLRVTEVGQRPGQQDYDTHHIVLDFGDMPFPVLEGQSIGIIPPGVDASGRPHHPRQYSVADRQAGARGLSGSAGTRCGLQLSV